MKKLNSRSGVSFLIALLLFMAAVVVAAIITSAALSSTKQSAVDIKKEQTQLTLQSAALLVQSEINPTITSTGTSSPTHHVKAVKSGTSYNITVTTLQTSVLSDIVKEGLTEVSKYPWETVQTYTNSGNFQITVTDKNSGGSSADVVTPVDCDSLTLYSKIPSNSATGTLNYLLIAKLSADGQSIYLVMQSPDGIGETKLEDDVGFSVSLITNRAEDVENEISDFKNS